MSSRILFALAAATALMASPALASPLEVTNTVYQEVEVVGADGRVERRLDPASSVIPGGEVIYVIAVNNSGDQPADRLVITNPVPIHLEYLSAEGALVSVDGGRRFGALSSLTVRGGDGVRPATTADVTHVRWTIDHVAPGDAGHVSFRGRVK